MVPKERKKQKRGNLVLVSFRREPVPGKRKYVGLDQEEGLKKRGEGGV